MLITDDHRLEALGHWLRNDLNYSVETIRPASGDASFRRYFRVGIDGVSYIAMDAPPSRENVRPFLAVAALLRKVGVQVPEVFAEDLAQGFLLLSDFGPRSYLDELNPESADRLYGDALDTLLRIQQAIDPETAGLPPYDERLLRAELHIFREWFLAGLLGLAPTAPESALMDEVWRLLVAAALEQPRVCVHRDYHSRNLMVTECRNPGVLDFQDAVIGPVTYDLVSLLRDCYVAWPKPRLDAWLESYRLNLDGIGMAGSDDPERFRRWFDLMGLQRHLKAIGIFARLKLRDGKPGYLKDIPRTLGYVAEVCGNYPQLAGFAGFLEEKVLSLAIPECPA
jgi:aminoglycoside/choline kinase family phosphotransferase